jgi:hypothetical protein
MVPVEESYEMHRKVAKRKNSEDSADKGKIGKH